MKRILTMAIAACFTAFAATAVAQEKMGKTDGMKPKMAPTHSAMNAHSTMRKHRRRHSMKHHRKPMPKSGKMGKDKMGGS